MEVTKLEEVTSNRYKVYVDEQFAFVLYKGELSRYHLKLESEISQELYDQIKTEIVIKRAKKRILYLLEQMMRTEQQIRTKMRQNYYTDDVIDEALIYAKSFGYINDNLYAKSFIQQKINVKSRKEIYSLLLGKGIDKDLIELSMEEAYEDSDSLEAIRNIARKKGFDLEKSTEKEKQKLYTYLMRKGFLYSEICQVLRVSEWNA